MATCRSCGAAIVWAKTTAGKAMPLNVQRSERGNIDLRGGIAHYVTPDANATPLRYVSHFATCPEAKSFRKARA